MSLKGIDPTIIQAFDRLLTEGLASGDFTASFSYLYYHRNRELAKAGFDRLLSAAAPSKLRGYLETTDKPELVLSEQLCVLLDHASSKDDEAWQNVILTLAQNSYWCRTLGYPTYLKYTHLNAQLAQHIVTKDFLVHLEPYHVGKFLRAQPIYSNDVLDSLLNIQEDNSKKGWVDEVLKSIVKHVSAQNFKVEKYRAFVTRLHELFASDRIFAKMVLKNINLCTQWIGNGAMVAYKHPLFTDADFEELSVFFERYKFASIARQYRGFANLSLPPLPLENDDDNAQQTFPHKKDDKGTPTFRIETMFPEFKKLLTIGIAAVENHQTEKSPEVECLKPLPVFVSSSQMKRISKSHSLQDLLLESDPQMQGLESEVEKLKFG